MKHFIVITLLFDSWLLASAQIKGDDHDQSALNTNTDATYIRIIYNDSSQTYFRNYECPDGVWREKTLSNPTPSCICVKGVYAVSSGLCDEHFHIITGNEHCYNLDKLKIRKIFPLLDSRGFRGRATTVFRQDGPYFARLMSASNNYVAEGGKYVFRMNDPTVLSAFQTSEDMSFGIKCLQGQNTGGKSTSDLEASPVMQIATLPNCANEFWGEQSWCSTAGYFDYSWTITVGSSWSQNTKTSKAGMAYSGKCTGAPSLDPAPANYDNVASLKSSPNCDQMDTRYPRSTSPQPNPFVYNTAKNMTLPHRLKANWHTESQHQITANEITRKVGKDLVAFALSGKKLPGLNSTDFKFLQQAKVIFLKVCPKEDIPIPAINFVIRAFRLLFLESQKEYSHNPIKDIVLEKSIEDALKECEASAQYIKYYQGNCSKFPETVETKSGDAGALANSSLYYNNKTDQNITLPPNILFQPSGLSFPIELAWKLVAHTHYFCAGNFKSGYEHSAFQSRMEDMLTSPPLLYQWKHPGASLQVFQVLLSRFDLADLAQKVDRCVAYAQSVSPYKEWLNRPADFISSIPKSRKKRYHFSNNFWNNKAYCLSNSEELRTHVTTYHEGLCGKAPVYYKNSNA